MITFTYAAAAVAFLVLVRNFVRKPRGLERDEVLPNERYAPRVGSARWLDLSERIFDPSDARWLKEELAFPKLARELADARKRLAISWLQSLQVAFDEVVRTPESALTDALPADRVDTWRLLWVALRFKFLVSYALLVVRIFGPYHRLIPSFALVPFPSDRSARRAAWAGSRTSN